MKSIYRILQHFAYMFCLGIIWLYLFFYIALPHITRKGKIVQVPNLIGLQVDLLDDHLAAHRLRYVITDDESYSELFPPYTVVQQIPAVGSLVKENRKIYISLNAAHPPLVAMPNLVEGSLKEAQLLLKNQGLQLGKVKYVPDIVKHTVLEQWYQDRPIAVGKLIPRKAVIDLVVGVGLGKQDVEVPDLCAIALEEARLMLLEQGLSLGNVCYTKESTAAVGDVLRQEPAAGSKLKMGAAVHLWIAGAGA